MPDTLRIVTFSPGGRAVEVLNLNDGATYFRERTAEIAFTSPAQTVQWARTSRRFGGSRAVGETHDNGSLGWTAYVHGTSLTAAEQAVEALIAAIESETRGRFIEWAPEGGKSGFFEVAGPGSWQPAYDPVEFVQTNAMRVALTFPVLPLVRWAPMTIGDPYDVDSLGDYTFDALTAAVHSTSGGSVGTAASLTTERRVRHTARGYQTLEGWSVVSGTPRTTITGYKLGATMRASAADTYIEVYADDNGTNSRLRIDVVIAGTPTNRASTNLATRLVSGTRIWVRARVEGDVVTAEYFEQAPIAATTPLTTTSYTLTSPEKASLPAGYAGWTWIPQNVSAGLYSFDFRPFAYRALTWPRSVTPLDPIPGSAPALADATLTVSGGTNAPAFAMIGWAQRLLTPVTGDSPFGIFLAAGTVGPGLKSPAVSASNVTSTADAGALGGSSLQDTVAGVEAYDLSWLVDPTALAADTFTASEVHIEVWLRASFAATVVSPTAVLSATSSDGTSFGAKRYSAEWGSAGRLLTPSGVYQFHRLGTLALPADPRQRRAVRVGVAITTAGGTGLLALDYAVLVPARQRALSPTAKELDAAYPVFIGSTAATVKTVRSDLSALTTSAATAGTAGMPDNGLGGALIEPPAGAVDWLLKLSSGVPDDPTPPGTAEQLTHSASFQLDVIPRSFMLRSA